MDLDFNVTTAGDGLILTVRVQPKSSRLALAGVQDGRLKLCVTAPPVDDAANGQCIAFFARALKKKKRDIRMIAGARSRNKTLRIEGLDEAAFRKTITRLLRKD